MSGLQLPLPLLRADEGDDGSGAGLVDGWWSALPCSSMAGSNSVSSRALTVCRLDEE
jgi:hypothetical protein